MNNEELSYEEWQGILTPEDLEGDGVGKSLTLEELRKAAEILDKAATLKSPYIASRYLASN